MRRYAFIQAVFLIIAIPLLAQTQSSFPICIPQFVDGTSGPLRWQTTLMIHNPEMTQTQVRLHFYQTDGQPLQTAINERERRRQRIQAGSDGQATIDLNARTASSFRSMGQGLLQGGSCVIESAARLQVHAMIQTYDTQGNLLQETGIVPHSQFRAGNIFVDQSDNAAVGVALTNPGEEPVAATFEFIAEDGTTILGSLQVTLGPHAQIARFIREMFPAFPDGIGFIRITTSNPVCGMALRLRGLNLSQVPVFINQ